MKDPLFDKEEITELTEEEYIEGLEELGLEPQREAIKEIGRLTVESTERLAEEFEEFAMVINSGTSSFTELKEMHQRLEPKHARSPKRHLLHKKAVENRKKRKRGGKK